MNGRTNRAAVGARKVSRLPLYGTWLLTGCIAATPSLSREFDDSEQSGDSLRDTGGADTETDTLAALDGGSESDASAATDTSDEAFARSEWTFQNGADGYQSAVDVELRQAYPDIAYPSNQTLRAYRPFDVSEGNEQQVLVRFGNPHQG